MSEMTTKLLELVNDYIDSNVYLEEGEFTVIEFYMNDENDIKEIINTFNFDDIGNIYQYPDVLPQPEIINGNNIVNSYEGHNRICISEKLNAILHYTTYDYYISCNIIIDKSNLKKFIKRMKPLIQQSKKVDIFKNIDFSPSKKEFYEISDADYDGDYKRNSFVNVVKKKLKNENLVYDSNSEIFNVMNDIKTFFKKETKELYNKMDINYRRGVIIYGEPGNGKSAMIREVMRQLKEPIKIIISPNISNITKILSSLVDSLNNKPSIIVIEDIDSLINMSNRSAFLNLLDGVDVKSGVYFIGTTNYPERIDPAFVNRSGRFDRSYKIDNPSEPTRRLYFQSRNIDKLLSPFKIHKKDSTNSDLGVIELFVKYSDNLSMANLKELMITTQYMLATNKVNIIEEALEKNYKLLSETKKEHDAQYNEYSNKFKPYN